MPTPSSDSPSPHARDAVALALLIAVLTLGAFLRLHDLGEVDFRGDEVSHFLGLQDDPDSFLYLLDHLKRFGHDRQMPLPRVLGAAATQYLGVEVDARGIRLPFALAGVASVLAYWVLGWQLGARVRGADPELSLALAFASALFVAINPFHLYWSRTAHIYVYPMLFLGLALAGAVGWLRCLEAGRERETGGRAWLATAVAGSILAGYGHMSAWLGAGVLWLVLLGAWMRRHRPDLVARLARSAPSSAPAPAAALALSPWPRALVIAVGIWGLFLLPWAWQFVTALVGQSYDPVWDEQTNPLTRFGAMWRVPFLMTWGGGWRSVLTLGLPAAAFALGWRHPRWASVVRTLAGAGVFLFALLSLAQSTGFYAFRYYVPLWPLFLVLSALGAWLLAEAIGHQYPGRRGPGTPAWAFVALVLLPVLAMVQPVTAVLELRGNPVEFTRLAKVLDQVVDEGTPALVNGMNVVLFEMRPHMPEKAIPTFTVSDVGLRQWRENDWRGSAERFFQRFPEAVLVQQGRNFYDDPEIGPWAFPEAHFTQHLELRNEPALLLRRLLLAGSLDFYSGDPENSRSVIRIHYDRPDDLVAKARAAGMTELVRFGEGWRYHKARDLMDWYLLEERAEIVVHNLADQARPLQVALHCLASGRNKEVRVEDPETDAALADTILVPHEGSFVWRFTVQAQPGDNTIALVDELFDAGQTRLAVARVEVEAGTADKVTQNAGSP